MPGPRYPVGRSNFIRSEPAGLLGPRLLVLSFKCLSYQVRMYVKCLHSRRRVTGIRARFLRGSTKKAIKSKGRRPRTNHPLMAQGGSDEKYQWCMVGGHCS